MDIVNTHVFSKLDQKVTVYYKVTVDFFKGLFFIKLPKHFGILVLRKISENFTVFPLYLIIHLVLSSAKMDFLNFIPV